MAVRLDKKTAQRMGAATLYVERQIKGTGGDVRNMHRTPLLGNYTAKTKSTISERDGVKAGSGDAVLQIFDKDTEEFSEGGFFG